MIDTPHAEIVARASRLTKRFGNVTAVHDLTIEVRAGEVYGFLGPNGAGKSTTIKLLLGLIAPTTGDVRLFGKPLQGNLPALLRRVGAIIEEPALYPYLSGRDNLRALATIDGIDDARVDVALATVDLTHDAGRRYQTYSLGMKQRLGIAATLIRDPLLIFLDEPTRGLDPAGQIEMRELFPRLAREGRTIFVSSHLMHELQHICDRVAILRRGELVAEGTVESLLRGARGTIDLVVPVTEAVPAEALLRTLEWVDAVDRDGERISVTAAASRSTDVNRLLAGAGIFASEIHPREQSLEEFFLDVTGDATEVDNAHNGARR